MARFVKYTQTTQTASGKKESFVYINVEHVAKATFNPESGDLTLMFSAGIALADGETMAVLKGQEAAEALDVIRTLS